MSKKTKHYQDRITWIKYGLKQYNKMADDLQVLSLGKFKNRKGQKARIK